MQPIWWPKEVSFHKKSKLLDRQSSLTILQAYRDFIAQQDEEQVKDYRDRSPNSSPEQKRAHVVDSPIEIEEVSTSSSIFPLTKYSPIRQPESTYIPENTLPSVHVSLVTQSGVIPLSLLKVEFRVLGEVTRTQCLKELDNPKTFLSDITMNAFSVSFKFYNYSILTYKIPEKLLFRIRRIIFQNSKGSKTLFFHR